MSLFKRDIDPMCIYCALSHQLSAMEIVCVKKGVRKATDHCRHFRYDPMRRIPPRPKKADFSGHSPEDFTL